MMAANIHDLRQWFRDGVAIGATHMIVVCDTYDYEDYPVYVSAEENVHKKSAAYSLRAGNMQKVMEVYKLSMDMEDQLDSEVLVFNY
jgi:hypothetical protein